MKRVAGSATLLAAIFLAVQPAWGKVTWDGGGDKTNWFDAVNWDSEAVPVEGDEVEIGAGATVLLTNSTAGLAAFTMTGGTVTFSNWTTRLTATNITLTAGTVTLPLPFYNSEMSNRVWFGCAGFTLGSNATIDVVGRGYRGGDVTTGRQGQGPGGGPGGDVRQGASYGGRGNRIANTVYLSDALPYGSAESPLEPGSGGGGYNYNDTERGGDGGGAVLIDASDDVILHGSILANGTTGGGNSGSGSGGAVCIVCRTISGTGAVSANGANTPRPATSGNGGGGRIAVSYTPAAQAVLDPSSISFHAGAGTAGSNSAQWGSVYFSGTHLLAPVLDRLSGHLYCGASTSWAVGSLTVSNGVRLTLSTNFTLVVSNELRVCANTILTMGHDQDNGTTGGLTVGGGVTLDGGQLRYYFAENHPEALMIGGGLTMTNGASLDLYAGPTNTASASEYGGLLDLSGRSLVIPSNGVIRPCGHPTNGAAVEMRVGSLTVAAGGEINADGRGGTGGRGSTDAEKTGFGLGAGAKGQGGGYGGRGGNSGGGPYGSETGPMHVGSGGGGYPWGTQWAGAGGGLVHVAAEGNIVLDGWITARGVKGEANTTGGSGGGVFLACRRFYGTGSISADGGDTPRDIFGAGGGGRVVVWTGTPVTPETPLALIVVSETAPDTFAGAYPTVAAGGGSTAPAAEPGTVRFVHVFPSPGTVFVVH